jgi:hypothetical protein
VLEPEDRPPPGEPPADAQPATAPLLDTAVSVAAGADPEPKPIPELVVQALAAVGTGVGVLGFVIFCGAAVIFIRLDAVGLPATEAVARVPREVLLATGAPLLAPAALLAVVTVAVLYAYNVGSQTLAARALERIENELRANARELHAKLAVEQQVKLQNDKAMELASEALQAAVADLTAASSEEARTAAELRLDAARQAYDVVDGDRRAIADRLAPLLHQQQKIDEAQADEQHRRDHNRNIRIGLLALLLIAITFGLAAACFTPIDKKQLALILVTTVVGGLLALAAGTATQRFSLFGVVAFLSIGVVFGMAKFFATENDPKVAPAAVLRSGHQPAAGFLVADTGDVLLLAQASPETTAPQMLVMPRGEIDDLVLGGATDPAKAQVVALGLLVDLCAEHVADARADGGPHAASVSDAATPTPLASLCTTREITQVRQTLAAVQARRRSN